jgi:CRISPR-associated protein Cmr1
VQRSKVLVQVLEVSKPYTEDHVLVPHKSFMKAKAFPPRLRFDIRLTLKSDVRDEKGQLRFGKEHLQALFILTCYLGGFGKRVRRGMGSVDIVAIDDKTDAVPSKIDLPLLFDLIQKFSPYYRLDADKIVFTSPGISPAYGYIVEIQLGNTYPNPGKLLNAISSATHYIKQSYGLEYDPSMGHASKGRYASPVYVSVVRGSVRPVVTTLNLAPDRDAHRASLLVQKDFKRQII